MVYLPPRSASAGIRSIRRELQQRRCKPLAPTRSVAKNPSVSPPPRHGLSDAVRSPCPRPPHREVPSSTNNAHFRGSAVADAPPQPRPRSASSCCTPASLPPQPQPPLRPGTVVGVRTRTTTLKTGQVLVLWLKATVVSSTSHGGYEVVYDGGRPSGDPKGTVRVERHHVRVIKTSPSAMTPPPQPTAAAAQKKETLPAARPTTAGKSVRVIRRIMLEKERQACAAAALSGIGH